MFNSNGEPVDVVSGHFRSPGDYENDLDSIVGSFDNYVKRCIRENKKPKLMFFVHGGLVTPEYAIESASRDLKQIQKDGYYPIFVAWDAGFFNSYCEDLVEVRRGEHRPFEGPLTAPFIFTYQLVRGVAHAPILWVEQWSNDIEALEICNSESEENVKLLYKELRDEYARNPASNVECGIGGLGEDARYNILRSISYFFTVPVKMLSGIVIDTGGTPSWNNLKRRARAMFHTTNSFNVDKDPRRAREVATIPSCSYGGLYTLVKKLESELHRFDNKDIEITVIGHSMGTIVLNEMLKNTEMDIDNIVYMGAACSIRDFRDAVVPYMLLHKNTQFYNLCLHPIQELTENYYFDLVQRGSLLVWIDNFLENPFDFQGRTLGQWLNVVQATHIIDPDVKGRVHIKAFGAGTKYEPQTHGGFDDYHYWKPEYRQIEEGYAVNEFQPGFRYKNIQQRTDKEEFEKTKGETKQTVSQKK